MRRSGNSKPALRMAARTRSRASCTAVSGSPTMLNAGSPLPMSTSTSTGMPSTPTTAPLRTLASVMCVLRWCARSVAHVYAQWERAFYRVVSPRSEPLR